MQEGVRHAASPYSSPLKFELGTRIFSARPITVPSSAPTKMVTKMTCKHVIEGDLKIGHPARGDGHAIYDLRSWLGLIM